MNPFAVPGGNTTNTATAARPSYPTEASPFAEGHKADRSADFRAGEARANSITGRLSVPPLLGPDAFDLAAFAAPPNLETDNP
jgi:hypothetical protein